MFFKCKFSSQKLSFQLFLIAGDILYIPRYWWHQVRSFNDPNIAIGMWFDIFDFQGEFERRRIDDTEDVVKV